MKRAIQIQPQEILGEIFKSYYFCSIEREEAVQNSGIVIDDGLFEIKFIKQNNIEVESQGELFALPSICIIGKVPLPSKLIIPDKLTYLTIKIQPWLASFFLDKNYSPITDLGASSYPNLKELHTKIFASNTLEEQIKFIEDYFLKRDLPELVNYEISKKICEYISENQGNVKVKEIVDLFPHSRQYLNQLFLEQTKNSIKEFAVLTRLRAIMTYRIQNPEQSLTSIAYDFGYFDQSHFIKDMKKVTGVTPSEFSKTNNVFYEQIKKAKN